jgi:S1-C subfamily serine protease
MTSTCRRGLLLLLCLLLGAALAAPPRPAIRPAPAQVYRKARTATAWVLAGEGGKGTGWVVDRSRRLLVTGYHVVGESARIEAIFAVPAGDPATTRADYLEHLPRLRHQCLVVSGRVVRRSRAADLALVELDQLPQGVVELPLAAEPAGPGDRVSLVGNRYDTEVLWVFSGGAVRNVQRLRDGYFNAGRQLARGVQVLVAEVPINEGDSGAALVNERGAVVGVAAAVAWEVNGAGLFIDLRELRAFLERPATESQEVPAVGAAVYRDGLASLVVVQGPDAQAHASGCVLDAGRRLVLTTAEVVDSKAPAEAFFPARQGGHVVAEPAFYKAQADLLRKQGLRVKAKVLAADPRRNLALLEVASVPAEARPVRLADAVPAPGDSLHALGSPRRAAFWWAYASAVVRQRAHARLATFEMGPDPEVLLLQAVLGDGEAGGPVLDDTGALVGIVSGKSAPQQQISYALAVSEVRAFLTENHALAAR